MKIVVFDTETIDTEHPYCYNVGFVVYDTNELKVLAKREYVIEQVWHNPMLFSTAYYADKRPIYVNRMKGRKIKMAKWGFVCREMKTIFETLDVELAFAYNSSFDERVFNFNTDFFHTINPFDNIPIKDIIPYVHNKIGFTPKFKAFCETNELFTESGNYSANAENVYRFLKNSMEFTEEHTALADSEIELEILLECIKRGCEWNGEYKKYRSIPRKVDRVLTVEQHFENETRVAEFDYKTIKINKEKTKIILKNT